MTSKKEELKIRKDRILGITVNQYIQTITPVSSQRIASEYPMGVSSATVRSVLAELEYDGFLTHPHTSAGRVPTEKGYRYYVDNLMNEIQLLEDEKKRIKTEYEKQCSELEDVLDKTSQVISDVTQYTSIVSVDGWDNKLFLSGTSFVVNYPQEQDLKNIRDILYALDEKEQLLRVINRQLASKINIYIGHEIALAEMQSCSLVVSPYKTRKGTTGRMAVLGPTRMNYQRVVSALDYLGNVVEEVF